MPTTHTLAPAALRVRLEIAQRDHGILCAQSLSIDMTRGKPSPEQLDLSAELLTLPGNGDYFQADGGDTRNYYGSQQGLPEARALFSPILGAPPEQIVVGGNSSLAMMHDCIMFALLKGLPESPRPWAQDKNVAFLCPSPGYDRHFAILETYGIRMIPVSMTGAGPDMDEVEALVHDPAVRGMWCVPKYSNPTGETYSRATIERLARMETAAADFRLFWDNAYAVHHLTDNEVEISNILELCVEAGNSDRAFVFGSTSKITFAGAGLALCASSPSNVAWLCRHNGIRTIGPNKINQLRHVRFFGDSDGIRALMRRHRALIEPKFGAVHDAFNDRLGETEFATWNRPLGGYFVNVDVQPGCAKRVVGLAKQAGIAMVPAGQTFPYGNDPDDTNLRIAPTFPSLGEVKAAAEAIALCIDLAVCEVMTR
jgi:DNA-binding transcriptional MocR family regulator